MQKILYDVETVRILADTFKCSRRMVRYALAGQSNSDLSHKIRKCALEMGCVEKAKAVARIHSG